MDKKVTHIISTKKLNASSIVEIEKAGFSVYSYDAISIEFRDLPELESQIKSHKAPLVFTSKNGVTAAINFGLKAQNCYAISPATSAKAQKEGFNILAAGKNANELAAIISDRKEKEVVHLTTRDRRENLYAGLHKRDVKLHEYEVYFKSANYEKHKVFDALLVFAPSQLNAFTHLNNIKHQTLYCIGETTATYARNLGFTKVKYSAISSEEELINFAIQDLKNE